MRNTYQMLEDVCLDCCDKIKGGNRLDCDICYVTILLNKACRKKVKKVKKNK